MTQVKAGTEQVAHLARGSQEYGKVTRETCLNVRQTLKEKASVKAKRDGLQNLGKKLTKKSPFPTYRT
jgi:hypothetical protein